MNALNGNGHLPQDPHLVSAKAELGALKVAHLEASVTDETVVHE